MVPLRTTSHSESIAYLYMSRWFSVTASSDLFIVGLGTVSLPD